MCGRYDKIPINWIAYKYQKFIYQGFGGQEVQDQSVNSFSICWKKPLESDLE